MSRYARHKQFRKRSMPGNQYTRGRRKEWACVKLLKSLGWHAQRSAGSKGLWDVTAAKRGQRVKLIQCKYTAEPQPGPGRTHPPASVLDKNAQALLALEGADETPIEAELWVYHRGRTAPVVYRTWDGAWRS